MKYNASIDFLKCLCIVSVIVLHSLTLAQKKSIGDAYYLLQAVPLFIIISGYNFTNSYLHKNISIREAYKKENLKPKIVRILFPFLIMYIIQVLIIVFIRKENLTFNQYIIAFMQGGWGPGSYYVPLMLQLILTIPVLYFIAKFNKYNVLILSFLFNLLFEVIIYNIDLPNSIYKLCLLRYFFALGLGVYYAYSNIRFNLIIIFGAIISLIYITMVEYLNYIPIAHKDWRSQNTLSYLYPFSIFVITVQNRYKLGYYCDKFIKLIGKSTYHIFLFQKLYFWQFWSMLQMTVHNTILRIISNIFICLLGGVLFYLIEIALSDILCKFSKYLHHIIRKIKKSDSIHILKE